MSGVSRRARLRAWLFSTSLPMNLGLRLKAPLVPRFPPRHAKCIRIYHYEPDKLCLWSPLDHEVTASQFRVVFVHNYDNNMDRHFGKSGSTLSLGCKSFGLCAKTTLLLCCLVHAMSLAPRVVALVSSVSQMSGVYSNCHGWIVFYAGD